MGLSVSFDHTPFQMKLNTKNTKNTILWLSFMFCLAATVFYIVVYEKINHVNIRYLKDAINLIWYRFHLESSQINCFLVFQTIRLKTTCNLSINHSVLVFSSIIVVMYHLSTPLRRCFFSLLSFSATRLREYIPCCMCRTAFLKNDSTAEKRREEEAFALASIAHYCFVEIKSNCDEFLIFF